MRRRVLLTPEVIAASRNFVNVRLNGRLDETNFKRMHMLIGSQFSGGMNVGNTVFCIFEPTAKGLTADSFPTEESVYYGSRIGGLYPYCISRANDPPMGTPEYDALLPKRIEFIKKRRFDDLGETEVDPKLIERIIWEGDHGADGPGLARIMMDLAAKHPLKPGAAESLPVLPLIPTLREAINLGATDNRAVVAIVLPSDGKDTMSASMARLLFEQGIAGRVHTARMTAEEWAEARSTELVKGGDKLAAGIFFMSPDYFGLQASVDLELPPTANEAELRAELTGAVQRFRQTWSKPSRMEHVQMGVAEKVSWSEWDVRSREFIKLPPYLDAKNAPPAPQPKARPKDVENYHDRRAKGAQGSTTNP